MDSAWPRPSSTEKKRFSSHARRRYIRSIGRVGGIRWCRFDYVYKQRRAYPSVAAGLTLGANSSAHTWWRGLTTCTILCAGCCLRVQFESVGLSLLVALASMARNWVWPGRTCFPSTSFAPHCGGWKFFFFFFKWEAHQVRSAALLGVRDTFHKSTSRKMICRYQSKI